MYDRRASQPPSDKGWGSNELLRITTAAGSVLGSFDIQYAARVQDVLEMGYAPRTNRGDDGKWRKWEAFCKSMDTSPWRTDMAANSGADPELGFSGSWRRRQAMKD